MDEGESGQWAWVHVYSDHVVPEGGTCYRYLTTLPDSDRMYRSSYLYMQTSDFLNPIERRMIDEYSESQR